MKEMIIPNMVKSIGTSAFEDCTSLDSVAINGLITEITNDMFRNCSSLRSITIPNTVRKIGLKAFSRSCSILTELHYLLL